LNLKKIDIIILNISVYYMVSVYYKDGYKFSAPSTVQGKKYDVFDKDGKKLASFGALGYEQFHDKIGHYSSQNHEDPKRRARYALRHRKDIHNKPHAGYFAYKYLW
jgi:hypothetical protein